MKQKKRDIRFLAGIVLSVAAFGLVLGLFLSGVTSFLNRTRTEGAKTLQDAVTRACVQCYAIEGRYPPSVDYLRQEYGIQIDETKYAVFYSGFASNIMPEITVVPLEEESLHTDKGGIGE